MNLSLEETQYLLRYGGYGILYPRNTWDVVIISAIEHNLNVDEMNELLRKLGEVPIFYNYWKINKGKINLRQELTLKFFKRRNLKWV